MLRPMYTCECTGMCNYILQTLLLARYFYHILVSCLPQSIPCVAITANKNNNYVIIYKRMGISKEIHHNICMHL